MPRKPFFQLGKLKLKYHLVGRREKEIIEEVPLPRKITLFLKRAESTNGRLLIRVGDRVRTGQKLLSTGEGGYLISTVTGTVSAISEHTGYFGQTYPAVSIEPVEEDRWDDTAAQTAKEPTAENALQFWGNLPGTGLRIPLKESPPPRDHCRQRRG